MVVVSGEDWFSMEIDVVRPVMNDVSQSNAMPVIPISCRRLMSMSWLIVSKAADTSSSASIEPYLLPRLESKSLVIFVSAVSVDFLGMYADWSE